MAIFRATVTALLTEVEPFEAYNSQERAHGNGHASYPSLRQLFSHQLIPWPRLRAAATPHSKNVSGSGSTQDCCDNLHVPT